MQKVKRGENIYGRKRIGEKIRNSIYEKMPDQHSFIALWGGIFPSVLKGVLWGSLLLRKETRFCFGVHRRFAKLQKVERKENVYGRKRIGEKIRNSIYEKKPDQHSFIALWGGTFPSVLKGVLWGSLLLRKGALFCFEVHQRFAELQKVDRGEKV